MPRRRATPPPPPAPAEVRRVRQRFEQLLAVGNTILSEHSLDAVLQRVVDAAREVIGARYAALGVMNEEGTGLVQFVTSGLTQEQRDRIGDPPRGHGLLGVVIRDARPIRTADIAHHPQRYGFPPHHPQMRSFLGAPIIGRERIHGNLYLTDKIGATEFDQEDEDITVLLATQAAVAMENAWLLGQVRDMQRQRDLFFAMMNHELRNALTGVFGWAERLVRKRSPESAERAGREVYEAAERTITLLNNFLDLTRLDAGKVRLAWRDVDVASTIEHALAGLQPVADAKHITITTALPPGPLSLRSDPVRLEQILVNLLSNAVRHSPEGGMIRVEVEPQTRPQGVVFRVADQGPGVPAELQAKIFEPFERYDPYSGVGTGLGLPVSRRLAEVMGGHLSVQSVDASGATFILQIPLAPPET